MRGKEFNPLNKKNNVEYILVISSLGISTYIRFLVNSIIPKESVSVPFLLAEILNCQGSAHRYGVGSFNN